MGARAATPKDRNPPPPARAWVVEIPDWLPPKKNAVRGRHWRAEHRAKRSAADILAVYAALAGVPKVGPKNPAVRTVAVTLYGWPTGRVPDPDATVSLLLDAMKRAGLIIDDAADWCVWVPPVVVRAAKRKTVIEIGDVA